MFEMKEKTLYKFTHIMLGMVFGVTFSLFISECEHKDHEENTPKVCDLGDVYVDHINGHEFVYGQYDSERFQGGIGIYHTISCSSCTPEERKENEKKQGGQIVMVMEMHGHQYVLTKYKERWASAKHSKNCPCTKKKLNDIKE